MAKDRRYVTSKIENKKEVVVDATGTKTETLEDFCKALPENEACFALVDVDYTRSDGMAMSKLTFVFWSPDDTRSVSEKVFYAGSKEAINDKFPGFREGDPG